MLSQLIQDSANKYGIEFCLLNAIVATESGFNSNAIRFEEHYKYLYSVEECAEIVGCTKDTMIMMQRTSWGLCQLMGAVYYEMQGKTWATELMQPDVNLKFTCEYVNRLIDRWHLKSPELIYAAYNAGSVRRREWGELVNQKNVDRFMQNYKTINHF